MSGQPGAPGATGPAGAPGAPGAPGSAGTPGASLGSTFTGTVSDGSQPGPAGTPVVASLVDLDGRPVAAIGSGLTDASGKFSLVVDGFTAGNSSVVLEATLPSGAKLHSFLGALQQDVSPVTEGVYRIIEQIVSSPSGRTVLDYTPGEFAQLVQAGTAALQTAGTDLSDPVAVHQALLANVGTTFVSLSGATAFAQPRSWVSVTDPAGALVPYDFTALVGGGELWDIQGDGDVSDGTNDSYDGMFYLSVNGTQFGSQSGATAQLEDDRQVVLGPDANINSATGLNVTRKMYSPANDDWARFTEVLSNPTAADVTVTVNVWGNLGSDESVNTVDLSSSGDTTVDANDVWLVNHMDPSDPALGFLFPGAIPSKSGDNIYYEWDNVVVPAGQTVTLVHWGFQRSDKDEQAIAARLSSFGAFPPAEFYAGLTQAEVTASANAGQLANVGGGAGAFVPGEAITVTNLTSGATVTGIAGTDGSFNCGLNVASGDSVQVVGSLGTNLLLSVP